MLSKGIAIAFAGTNPELDFQMDIAVSPILPLVKNAKLQYLNLGVVREIFDHYCSFPSLSENAISRILMKLTGPPRVMETFLQVLLQAGRKWILESKTIEFITENDLVYIVNEALNKYTDYLNKKAIRCSFDFDVYGLYVVLVWLVPYYGGLACIGSEEAETCIEYRRGTMAYKVLESLRGHLVENGLCRLSYDSQNIKLYLPYFFLLQITHRRIYSPLTLSVMIQFGNYN